MRLKKVQHEPIGIDAFLNGSIIIMDNSSVEVIQVSNFYLSFSYSGKPVCFTNPSTVMVMPLYELHYFPS